MGDISNTFGNLSALPYSFALVVGLWAGLGCIDWPIWVPYPNPTTSKALTVFDTVFFSTPLVLTWSVSVWRMYVKSCRSMIITDTLFALCIAVFLLIYRSCAFVALASCGIYSAVWLVWQTLVCFMTFHRYGDCIRSFCQAMWGCVRPEKLVLEPFDATDRQLVIARNSGTVELASYSARELVSPRDD